MRQEGIYHHRSAKVQNTFQVILGKLLQLYCKSIQMLWGMINSFQLITHLPLMTVNTPANVALFYNFILDVSNFQFFDVEDINSIIFDYNPDDVDDQAFNPYFDRMGYSSTNLIRNLGLIFYFYW
ncbi:UNKNOWN [Stylonychia lemnae]|uniref:Uncharacterized protein n=1 Tax=Stylonychia lemnae TaxID=5949 RepID=A0A077ZZA7_STYLE|nr:UNKNOWN [Stylonychia lemnae]|eukprot:CDW73828.1 UNKNOWN [Stylonychia lemnae]